MKNFKVTYQIFQPDGTIDFGERFQLGVDEDDAKAKCFELMSQVVNVRILTAEEDLENACRPLIPNRN